MHVLLNASEKFPVIEEELLAWVKERNVRGIRVKDRFIQLQCLNVRDRLLAEMIDSPEKTSLQAFQASRIWLYRFKQRFNLRSRRHTTTHTLPDQFRELAKNFIESVHKLCEDFDISRERIINMVQVPRYSENDKNTTITTKGTREVLLRKSSTSHKRFTFTPFITAQGKFLKKHALFSNLKNIPKNKTRCNVDVNKTGMWNERILTKEITEAAKISRGLFNLRSDHLRLIRRSYEIHQRKGGYLQAAQHLLRCDPSATHWIASTSRMFDVDLSAFDVCGLVPRDKFDIEKLHTPLQAAFNELLSTDEWLQKFSSLACEDRVAFFHSQVSLAKAAATFGESTPVRAFINLKPPTTTCQVPKK